MHPDSDFPERHLAPESPDTWALAVRLHRRTSRRSTEPATPAERPACNPTCNAGEGTVAAAPSSVPPDVSGRQIDLFSRLNGRRA